MKKIPSKIIEGLSPCEKLVVQNWWNLLDETTQAELSSLWMTDSNLCVNTKHHQIELENQSNHIQAKFIQSEEELDDESWNKDFYEYLVNHEIHIYGFDKSYHICTQHEAAKAVINSGLIPSNYICPLRNKNCPIRNIMNLNPSKSLKLEAIPIEQHHHS